MKPVIALIAAGILALVFETSSFPPYEYTNLLLRFFTVFVICSVLLAACLLPWYKAPFSQSWKHALLYGSLITFSAFDMGYLVFAISTVL